MIGDDSQRRAGDNRLDVAMKLVLKPPTRRYNRLRDTARDARDIRRYHASWEKWRSRHRRNNWQASGMRDNGVVRLLKKISLPAGGVSYLIGPCELASMMNATSSTCTVSPDSDLAASNNVAHSSACRRMRR